MMIIMQMKLRVLHKSKLFKSECYHSVLCRFSACYSVRFHYYIDKIMMGFSGAFDQSEHDVP